MPYVSGGQMLNNPSPWRASIFYDTFWSLVNFVVLFFKTMFDPDLSKKGSNTQTTYSNRPGNGPSGGGGGGPRRRMGGFGRAGGASPPPMAGGG